jgi:hypothetical protein
LIPIEFWPKTVTLSPPPFYVPTCL